MNIFFLDLCPKTAALYHCNKHVVKMIVETAQLLSMSHPLGHGRCYRWNKGQWRHPAAVWVRESVENYRYAAELGLALCREYTRRYFGRTHKTQEILEWLKANEPETLPRIPRTNPPLCMPPQYHSSDPVESYRRFYIHEKKKFAVWAVGDPVTKKMIPQPPPFWWTTTTETTTYTSVTSRVVSTRTITTRTTRKRKASNREEESTGTRTKRVKTTVSI